MSSQCDHPAASGPWQAEYVQLFVAHQRRIHAFIRTLVPNKADSEEVLQETSITGCEKFSSFESPSSGNRPEARGQAFLSWICTIARYEALRHYRKKKPYRVMPFSTGLFDDLADIHQQQSDYLESRYRALSTCMAKLSTSDRELVRHRYDLDHRPKEIAEHTGRPLNSIYKGLQRIRAALLTCIDRVLRAEEPSR